MRNNERAAAIVGLLTDRATMLGGEYAHLASGIGFLQRDVQKAGHGALGILRTRFGLELDFDRNGRRRLEGDRHPLQRSVTNRKVLRADPLRALSTGMRYEPIGTTGKHHAECAGVSIEADGIIERFAVPRLYLES